MSKSDPVAIITGASRGIGRALALGLAQKGYSVIVTAKSTESTARLPGSVFTVAEEITAQGGTALACPMDVRDEAAIEAMVKKTRDRFGRIDVLINNAGALYWKPMLETPAKRFDLVHAVNVRGPFLCCQQVLPVMAEQRSGHIINMSPPLDTSLLPGRIAYGISKLGMTMLTLGLAEEARPLGIAVNSLWPATIIESQASINWELGSPEQWRKPQILVDAVLRILGKKPPTLTGQTLIDEDFLRAEGVTDFSPYSCVPGTHPGRITWREV